MAALAQLQTDYDTYSLYDETGDVSAAQKFITTCRKMLSQVTLPKRQRGGGQGEEIEIDSTVIERQMNQARSWLSTQRSVDAGGTGVRHFSLENFRG